MNWSFDTRTGLLDGDLSDLFLYFLILSGAS